MTEPVRFHAQHQEESRASLHQSVIEGLSGTPKALSPKFFYDHRGSELFEQICMQPEYYLTRTEEAILTEVAPEIGRLAGPEALLVELGSGASRKIRLLLETLRPQSYLGVDISRDFLLESTRILAADYPWLDVHAVWADFSQRMALPEGFGGRRLVAFFPGSSIGNFTPDEAEGFLRNLHAILPRGSGLLIGVDLVKDPAVLNAAYNDAAGITAEFNRNLLYRLREELGMVVAPEQFEHLAFFNEAESRIEMHLVSVCDQWVTLGEHRFAFREGERLHTENSYKYSATGFAALAERAGFPPASLWTDAQDLFGVYYCVAD